MTEQRPRSIGPCSIGPHDGEVDTFLSASVASAVIPGVVVMAQLPGQPVSQWVYGQADTVSSRAMRADTLFDLASLTKVLSTTTLVLGLVGTGALALDRPLQAIVPQALAGVSSPVTIAHLLSHSSGLPAMIDLEQQQAAGVGHRDAILNAAPVSAPGRVVVYSDIGFMLLGMVIEAVVALPLRDAFAELVAAPLGLESTRFGPVSPDTAAATEPGANGVPWCGTVHDENARVMGGVGGHAGLFSTAGDVARFADWWLSDCDTAVPPSLRRRSERCQTAGTDGRRGLGWVCRGDGFDFLDGWPPAALHGGWPAQAVSHSGFTGTSIALDPSIGGWVVALTNAVHYGRDADKMRRFRRQLHELLRPDRSPASGLDR